MIKPCFGACIGFVGGLIIGWVLVSFILDPDFIMEFQDTSSISIILIAGVVGLVIGLGITYVTKKDEEESVFS